MRGGPEREDPTLRRAHRADHRIGLTGIVYWESCRFAGLTRCSPLSIGPWASPHMTRSFCWPSSARAPGFSCSRRSSEFPIRSCSCSAGSRSASCRASRMLRFSRTSFSSRSSRRFSTRRRSSRRSATCGETSARSRCLPSSSSSSRCSGRGRQPRRDLGAFVAGLLRARCTRRAHRRRRGERDRVAARDPAPARHADRGREPDQRRDGPRRVSVRRRGGRDRRFLVVARELALRRRRRQVGSRSASRSGSCSGRSGAG